MNNKKKVLVTGCAGFIGMHLSIRLLNEGYRVFGIDNINNYYDPKIKEDRLNKIFEYDNFKFEKVDISKLDKLENVFKLFKPDKVFNLAAQAGVRYSIDNPHEYISSNIVGFINILECVRHFNVNSLIYASSSSVYGANSKSPFSIFDKVNKPLSIYAASKTSNELMAYSYSSLYNFNTIGFRFFSVYGPWGRPDMAINIFTEKIKKNKKISVFNMGDMRRDFTHIDDIVNGVMASLRLNIFSKIFNLGFGSMVDLMEVIKLIENSLGKKALITYEDMQPGDVKDTLADIEYTKKVIGYSPKISIREGIPSFIDWHDTYYN